MPKPILDTFLFEGGALDGLHLTVQQGQLILYCTEVREGKEIYHQYLLSNVNTFQYKGTS